MNPAMHRSPGYFWRWFQRLLRALGWTLLSGGWLWWRACRVSWVVARIAPPHARGAVLLVPGYRLRDDEVTPAYARRLRRALELCRGGQRLLLSGYARRRDQPSEALAGFAYLCDLGLPADVAVQLDVCARDTEENLAEAARLLPPGRSAVIISNRWHLARCAWLARRAGLAWPVCAAERRWRPDLFAWAALLRDGLSLLSYCGPQVLRIDPRKLLEKSHR